MHTLITGTTGSGKSSLAKMIAKGLQKRGHNCLVLDPMQSLDWGSQSVSAKSNTTIIYKDSATFLSTVKESKDAFIFVDEAGTEIGRYNNEMDWLATTGRHFGHQSTFICHRVTQLSPVLRSNCSKCYLFATDQKSMEVMSLEFNQKSIEKIRLKQFEFLILSRFADPEFRRIVIDKGQVVAVKFPL